MQTSPQTRTRPRPRRWGHERWWSKPKSYDGERYLDARAHEILDVFEEVGAEARTTRSWRFASA